MVGHRRTSGGAVVVIQPPPETLLVVLLAYIVPTRGCGTAPSVLAPGAGGVKRELVYSESGGSRDRDPCSTYPNRSQSPQKEKSR